MLEGLKNAHSGKTTIITAPFKFKIILETDDSVSMDSEK